MRDINYFSEIGYALDTHNFWWIESCTFVANKKVVNETVINFTVTSNDILDYKFFQYMSQKIYSV